MEQNGDNMVGKLEEESRKRRDKLLQLRKAKGEIEHSKSGAKDQVVLPKPIFRSYNPQDDSLKENKLEPTKPAEVEELIKSQLESAVPELVAEEIDLSNLAPKKPCWDLNRNIQKSLEKLERRTQRAINELVRERLKEERSRLIKSA